MFRVPHFVLVVVLVLVVAAPENEDDDENEHDTMENLAMESHNNTLMTPIYVKTSDAMPWPEDKVFYLLSADNLYLCRNYPFFSSCVPAPRWPTELASEVTRLRIRYPKISQALMELLCGFFDHCWRQHGAEAVALLAWDESVQSVRAIIPQQVAAVGRNSWGEYFPISVKYRTPSNLRGLQVFCDVHSHGDMAAYASAMDVADEESRTGLHIVVGKLRDEPPEFHLEAVVDGTRFKVKREAVIESYEYRNTAFPPAWLNQVTTTNYASYDTFEFDADGSADGVVTEVAFAGDAELERDVESEQSGNGDTADGPPGAEGKSDERE